jgi:hypothetical protein
MEVEYLTCTEVSTLEDWRAEISSSVFLCMSSICSSMGKTLRMGMYWIQAGEGAGLLFARHTVVLCTLVCANRGNTNITEHARKKK